MSASEQQTYVSKLAGANASWLRFGYEWSRIEPQRGVFNWSHDDRATAAAIDAGLKVVGMLGYAPDWSHPGQFGDKFPPHNAADFGTFCRIVASRYPQVTVWEVWNEPNLFVFWKPRPDASAYVALLRSCYAGIKSVRADALVLAGSLSGYGAYNQQSPEGSLNPISFLERMYAAGAKGHFDALSHHPYEWSLGTAFHPGSSWSNMVDTTPSLRSLMIANGDAEKKIWGTEWGAPTDRVSETRQADLVREAFAKWRSYDWTGVLLVYQPKDEGSERFGFWRSDWSEKPAIKLSRSRISLWG
jgi:hypothetical protein